MARRISSSPILVTMATLQLLAICCLLQVISCFDQTLCAGSDSNGWCSGHLYPVPTPDAQADMLADFKDGNHFQGGNRTGCYEMVYAVDADDEYRFNVYAYFSCDGAPSDECRTCFQDGFDRLKDGCPVLAGGTVLLEKCCVRYETYDICHT